MTHSTSAPATARDPERERARDAAMPPVSRQIWETKYRLKEKGGTPIDMTPTDSRRRVAGALAEAEADPAAWTDTFAYALENGFLPAGRILAGAGTDRSVTLFNCFVMGTVPDSMSGIFDMLKEAALTMQQGGGIGYDFTSIRPKSSYVKGVGSDASGPLSFMDVWDAMCKTIMSAGARRGAMMATMRCDHPDVLDFVEAKRDAARLRNFNLSVLVTDALMEAVRADADWPLVHVEPPAAGAGERVEGGDGEVLYVHRTIRARELWDAIMKATYDYAEPGVIFIDRINQRNNLSYCETIAATNPCVPGETPILTRDGWVSIRDVVGREVDVWNGSEWSSVTPRVTGRDQTLITVTLDDGRSLPCTPAHRFVMKDGSRVAAGNLVEGDVLIRGEWPIISGGADQVHAYRQGFFSGDGWVRAETGGCYIGLYGDKRALAGEFGGQISAREYEIAGGFEGTDTEARKTYLYFGPNTCFPKLFVPGVDWSIASRLDWLAGLADSDGTTVRDKHSVSVQISAKDKAFLDRVRLMLNTLGATGRVARMKDCFRLLISASEVKVLQESGFRTRRLDLSGNAPRRAAARFSRVASISDAGRREDVYCFTEEARHMGCFNGILTGQCGEQPLPPYGACLLGSINLARLVSNPFTADAAISDADLDNLVATAVRMMDNVVDVSRFPLDAQREEARNKRRIGLGVTGLADALAMVRIAYGSDEAVAKTRNWMRRIAHAAYRASVDLAKEKGVFPLFDAEKFLASPTVQDLDRDLQDEIRAHGIRNGLLTSIAPTGTISLYDGNVSSGIEPVFSFAYTRKVLQNDGSRTEEEVVDYAVALYREMYGLGPDDTLPDYFVTAMTLKPEDHVRMQAAAQKWVDSSISKTVNCPEEITFEDFKSVYEMAFDTGCKGCTTYRPNAITGSVLTDSSSKKAEEAPAAAEVAETAISEPMPREDELEGVTYKIKWPGAAHAYYVTINDVATASGGRRPFEVFVNTQNTHDADMMDGLTRMISAVFRRGGDVSFVAEELSQIVNPQGGSWVKGTYVPSLVAMIGQKLFDHMRKIGYIDDPQAVARPVTPAPAEAGAPAAGEDTSKGKRCASCGMDEVYATGGCETCRSCGDSRCG